MGHFYLVGLLYYNMAANGRQLLYSDSDVHCFYMLAFRPPAGPRYSLQIVFFPIKYIQQKAHVGEGKFTMLKDNVILYLICKKLI